MYVFGEGVAFKSEHIEKQVQTIQKVIQRKSICPETANVEFSRFSMHIQTYPYIYLLVLGKRTIIVHELEVPCFFPLSDIV